MQEALIGLQHVLIVICVYLSLYAAHIYAFLEQHEGRDLSDKIFRFFDKHQDIVIVQKAPDEKSDPQLRDRQISRNLEPEVLYVNESC